MTEAAATRYLLSRGWQAIEDGWFFLAGTCNRPVCLETAYHMQRNLECVAA